MSERGKIGDGLSVRDVEKWMDRKSEDEDEKTYGRIEMGKRKLSIVGLYKNRKQRRIKAMEE